MTSTHVAGVLDLTFLDIKEEADLERGIADRLTGADSPSKSGKVKKTEEIKAIRLANNLIENLDILCGPLSRALDCSAILWIDLSFNSIKAVPESFVNLFPNITTIYLHANRISRLSVIKKISEMKNLKSLSLYGNPVEEHKVGDSTFSLLMFLS